MKFLRLSRMACGLRTPETVEAEHVHRVYDEIAPHFSHTRYKPWPKVAAFLARLPANSIVADIGCGNGKYLGCSGSNNVYLHGSDCCQELVEIARRKQHDVCLCDSLVLPYRDRCFDAVISIAVIHHFASEMRRLMAVQEMTRVLHVGGQLLIYVWAMEQKRKMFDQQDVFVPWHLQRQFVKSTVPHPNASLSKPTTSVPHETGSPADNELCKASTQQKDLRDINDHSKTDSPFAGTFQRYYHVFKEGELPGLVANVSQLEISESYYDHENWCVLAKRIQ